MTILSLLSIGVYITISYMFLIVYIIKNKSSKIEQGIITVGTTVLLIFIVRSLTMNYTVIPNF